MLRSSLLCLLPLVMCVTERGNDGVEYYGTSKVRYQKTYPPPPQFSDSSQSIFISTTMVSPPSRPAATTAGVPKTTQLDITTQSGPSYIPRRRPFILPRPSRQGPRPKQQATRTSIGVALPPTSVVKAQSSEISASQPAVIPSSQMSIVSAPQVVIQLISGSRSPLNTSVQTSVPETPVPPAVINSLLTAVPNVAVSVPKAYPVVVESEKKSVSFVSKPEVILEPEPISQPQAKPKIDPLPAQKHVSQPNAESILQSTQSSPTSGKLSYPIKLRPQITYVPVLELSSESVEGIDTAPKLMNTSTIDQGSAFKIPPSPDPVVVTPHIISNTLDSSSVNAVTGPPVVTAFQTPVVAETQPSVVIEPIMPFTDTETQDIPAPPVRIQLITIPQLPLNPVSQPALDKTQLLPTGAIQQPALTFVQVNGTANLQPPAHIISTLETTMIYEELEPKTNPPLYAPKSESIVESELVPQLEPETSAHPKPESEFQSKPNLPTPEQFSFVSNPEIDPKTEAVIDTYTTVPLLLHKAESIPESFSAFVPPRNATPQPVEFIASQPPITIKSHPIESTSIQNKTTPITTASKSNITHIETVTSQIVYDPHVIIQVIAPSQSSRSTALQQPVFPALNPLEVSASPSFLYEAPQGPEQNDLHLSSKISDSELGTSPESEQVVQPEPELSTHQTETTFEPEVEITYPTHYYPVKRRPQVSFAAVRDSTWKPVAIKPKPAVLPPLLPRPNPIREPAYGRHSQPITQYPITSSTHHMKKVPPVIASTHVPLITKPTIIRQPIYDWYTPPPTQYPIIATAQTTTRFPLNSVSNSERPGSFKPDIICKEGNGYYAINNECDTYILCQQNNATKFSCPDGLYFNPAAKYYEYPCVYSSEVQCSGVTGKKYPRPPRHCPKQYGLFSMNDGDCSKYIMCNVGVATVMNCPAGLVFNPTTESCDWVANVPQCNPQVFKEYTCPDPPVDEYGVATDIIYKYKYENQCSLYIACQRGYPRLLSCERGLAFDEASQSCITSTYVRNCASYAE